MTPCRAKTLGPIPLRITPQPIEKKKRERTYTDDAESFACPTAGGLSSVSAVGIAGYPRIELQGDPFHR